MLGSRIKMVALTVAILLCIPFAAMYFTKEVNWSTLDFVMAGCLLFATGLLLDVVIRKTTAKKRLLFISIVITMFLLIWIELAVGIW